MLFSQLSRGNNFYIFPKKEYLSSHVRIIVTVHFVLSSTLRDAQKEDSNNGT